MAQNGINSSSLVEAADVNIVSVLSRRPLIHWTKWPCHRMVSIAFSLVGAADDFVRFISQAIGTLEELAMPQNGINLPGIRALVDAIAVNTKLRVLNLNDNTFTEAGGHEMAKVRLLSHFTSVCVHVCVCVSVRVCVCV